MDRRTQASWLPAPPLMASISASGGTRAHGGPLGASPQGCCWALRPSEVCVDHICKVHCLRLEVGEVGGNGGACNMGEGGQRPSHPRPEPPAQPVWTLIRKTLQGPEAESGLGHRLALDRKHCPVGWGAALGAHPPSVRTVHVLREGGRSHMEMWSQALRSERGPSTEVWPQLYRAPSEPDTWPSHQPGSSHWRGGVRSPS